MQRLILEAESVSISGNIALYPALAANDDGCLGIAWYEYGSSHSTDRSDIWFSCQSSAGSWSKPVNVSGGVSYNNGPSLVWVHEGQDWCCAWHSWRSPGREPFVAHGDVTNIWLGMIGSDGVVQAPQRGLTDALNTEYASLAISSDAVLQLLYRDRSLGVQCLACSPDGFQFSSGKALPNDLGLGQHGDLACGPDGAAWVVYVGEDQGIYLASRAANGRWGMPRRLDVGLGVALTRPKLSLDADGMIWVACHSNTWGSRTSRYRLRTMHSSLAVCFKSDGTPGNHCWTCNAISLRGSGYERCFSFGPDVFAHQAGITPVTEEQCLYEPTRGYGFDRSPKSQLRKLGDEVTRGLFYDDVPTVFRVDVPEGEYEVEVISSPWISPTLGTNLSFEADILDAQRPEQECDALYILRLLPDGEVHCSMVSKGGGYNENRPSKVVHDIQTGRKHLAWTCYGPEKIEVVHASFVLP